MATSKASPGHILQFLRICGQLKTTKRTGWINHDVSLPESIADHMYRMAMCILSIDEKVSVDMNIDRNKCIKMALVHDLGEAIVGDITPHDGISKEEKFRREESAMKEITLTLSGLSSAEEITRLWEEYENGLSADAVLVKDIDKFEMILQADDYEQAQGTKLQDFFTSTKGCIQTPLVQSWVYELEAQRLKRLSSSDNI